MILVGEPSTHEIADLVRIIGAIANSFTLSGPQGNGDFSFSVVSTQGLWTSCSDLLNVAVELSYATASALTAAQDRQAGTVRG